MAFELAAEQRRGLTATSITCALGAKEDEGVVGTGSRADGGQRRWDIC